MILYVNGCSHTAAAEAVIPDCFAVDDGKNGIDRRPHPTNLAASYCTLVANQLGADLVCQAESGGSNPRILRTTREWIAANPDKLQDTTIVLQWTTWEREEWLHQGTWYQVNASGVDWVPAELQHRYKEFIAGIDWEEKTQTAHDQIWQLHQELLDQKIQHLFFSGHSTFSDIYNKHDWGKYYIDPYNRASSYHNWLVQNGGTYANPQSYHFDAKSHRLWAEFVLQYINSNQILDPIL
jgi:hypothetical protein